jgi:hypothetical protein
VSPSPNWLPEPGDDIVLPYDRQDRPRDHVPVAVEADWNDRLDIESDALALALAGDFGPDVTIEIHLHRQTDQRRHRVRQFQRQRRGIICWRRGDNNSGYSRIGADRLG